MKELEIAKKTRNPSHHKVAAVLLVSLLFVSTLPLITPSIAVNASYNKL
jgi:hypothetical protein